MSVPAYPRPEPHGPLHVAVDGVGLAACLEALLASPTSSSAAGVWPVAAMVVRSLGQGDDYVWLGFVTYDPSRGWERNGLAAEAPGMGVGRRIVVDLRALAGVVSGEAVVSGQVMGAPGRACVLEWRDDALTIGTLRVPAIADVVPPVPDVPAVRDSVYLSASTLGDVTVESEEGRINIPASLVSHLLQRGALVAELGVVDGDVYVVAQSERRGEASTDPVIVAPVRLLMWSDESSRARFQERRRQGGGEVEQLLTALDPATPIPVLLELLDTGVAYVRRRVAIHPGLPNEVTDALAESGTSPMRAAVALNPSLGSNAIALLARDPDPAVRAELARNPSLPVPVLEALAGDRDVDARAAAANHSALSMQLRAQLAQDGHVDVRTVVAGNPASGPELVRRLVADPDRGVSRAAAANPACPRDVLEQVVDVIPLAVLANPSAPEDLLTEGARNVDGAIRAVVAANPSTLGRVLTSLSRDPDARVLRAVATNVASPAPARRRAEKRVFTDHEAIVASTPTAAR